MPAPGKVGFQTLANELRDIMSLSTRHLNIKISPEIKIVRTIVQAMTKALLRGERVRIDGFGILEWRTRPAQRKRLHYFHGHRRHNYSEMGTIPAKRTVVFRPSKVLLHALNKETPE